MAEQGERYLRAWHALGQILQEGGSWSGHERNCCFLNTRSDRFADVSSAVGFDHDADTRGVALVDWDRDGDLDVWSSNRTSPRVRYLENQSTANNGYLVIRLQGTRSNRDAIGARLELTTETGDGAEHTQIQGLRAGEGYLSQSSKDVHFGLGGDRPVRLLIRWPSGMKQTFSNLQANTHYRVVEGEDRLSIDEQRNVQLSDVAVNKPVMSANLRVLPSRRLPVPQLEERVSQLQRLRLHVADILGFVVPAVYRRVEQSAAARGPVTRAERSLAAGERRWVGFTGCRQAMERVECLAAAN